MLTNYQRLANCPNCGKQCQASDLHHSSSQNVSIPGCGSYGSTLYGVCLECAERHREMYRAINGNAAKDRS